MELPDFLYLSEEDVVREKERQERLRRDFNSRVRLSAVEMEMARSLVLENDLRNDLATQEGEEAKRQIKNRLADIVASQGRFLEAAELTSDEAAKEFFTKAADAVHGSNECSCDGPVQTVGSDRIQLPKYRVIKQIYNLKLSAFGYLAECNACGTWVFLTSDPTPEAVSPVKFDPATTKNDLQRLKV